MSVNFDHYVKHVLNVVRYVMFQTQNKFMGMNLFMK
jgi:hypothetical protein